MFWIVDVGVQKFIGTKCKSRLGGTFATFKSLQFNHLEKVGR